MRRRVRSDLWKSAVSSALFLFAVKSDGAIRRFWSLSVECVNSPVEVARLDTIATTMWFNVEDYTCQRADQDRIFSNLVLVRSFSTE